MRLSRTRGRVLSASRLTLDERNMSNSWIDYPLSAIAAAVKSGVGGVVTIMLSIFLGTAVGLWVLDMPARYFAELPVYSFVSIGASCLQIWGFLYVAALISIAYHTLHEDASRLRIGYTVIILQAVVVIIVTIAIEAFPKWPAIITKGAIVGSVCLIFFFVARTLKRKLSVEG